MKVVADNKIPFLRGVFEKHGIQVVYLPGAQICREDLLGADLLMVRTRTSCDKKLLQGTSVKMIATATIGFDHIDTDYCTHAGIHWTRAEGCNASSVAQYVASTLLNFSAQKNIGLQGKTLAVVGVGHVGTLVAALGETLGMKVLRVDPPRKKCENSELFVSLEEVARSADFLSFHVPLEREGAYPTWHMADSELLYSMKTTSVLINTSRGEVVHDKALKKALTEKWIEAAVLDVWENEPDIDGELLEKVLWATPHIAGYSADGKAAGTGMCIRAAAHFFALCKELQNWNAPDPRLSKSGVLLLQGGGKSAQSLATEATNYAYDVRADDARLRKSPVSFEKLRGAYPLRREAPAYGIQLENCPLETGELLSGLGFQKVSGELRP